MAASLGELRPLILLLRVATHHKRDGLREFKHGVAIQRGKRLTIKLESNRQHAALRRVGALDNIADFFEPPRVLKINRFLGIGVKPEEWRYAWKMFESAHGNHLICGVL
jgi:hypothetical protein